MPQPQRMPQLMQGDTVQIDIRAHAPRLVIIEVHIPRNRFRIRSRRIKRMRQDISRPVERIGISMTPATE